jgi:HPt (histidine-containing phosphotransfer) domain-containing protein
MRLCSGLRPSKGGEKLAVLLPGMGAVATTAIAGVAAVRRGLASPGSITQLGYLPGSAGQGERLRDAPPLAALEDLALGGWDPIPDDVHSAAVRAKVLSVELLADLAQRAGEKGPQEWLSFFFKSPVTAPGRLPVHDRFQQQADLHAQLSRYVDAAATEKSRSAVG